MSCSNKKGLRFFQNVLSLKQNSLSLLTNLRSFSCRFAPKMPDGGKGVIEEHSRTSPAHYGADALTHIGAITMDGTLATSGFRCSERAALQALLCIFEQGATIWAKFCIAFFLSAIEQNHCSDGGKLVQLIMNNGQLKMDDESEKVLGSFDFGKSPSLNTIPHSCCRKSACPT